MDCQVLDLPNEIQRHWSLILSSRLALWQRHCSQEFFDYLETLELLSTNLPDFHNIQKIIQEKAQFSLIITPEKVAPQDYLHLLSQKCFPISQYVRPIENNNFSLIPDIVHDLLCHVPWLLSPHFASFFHKMGILFKEAQKRALLFQHSDKKKFALDRYISVITQCFWFSVETGLIKKHGEKKAYGAALLSSPVDLTHIFSTKATHYCWNLEKVILQDFDPSHLQNIAFVIRDFEELPTTVDSMLDLLNRGLLDFENL
ncbi:biopterin-dependent aromatic amino acid hydroxylase family protein [Chlamydia ibidis]|uniref:Biopterin-dependent aromatic amino acid hydroxylase family protein n=2 Tax=Chlamydia ibidis TaxID=1405396 RepID=S7J2G7_9CHLA|nr:biopterin-dependent aromatic amino acid hydroxylase family protein [Chlamydia ibidis]EPP34619.1 biopterin-dependent aromatic amino acid hydroxylase family protein [Chlamydia ibidis]EQM62478.1 biopterin-dependent aromatic amino acid hydroxylase family protein [Chlamydia ibidis 10-1398/6]